MRVAVLGLCLSAVPHIASAQMQWTDKGYVTLNVGFQAGSHDLSTSSTFSLYEEDATVSSKQTVKSGGFFEIGGAYKVWGHNLLAGVSYLHTGSSADVAISGQIPDPVVFNSPRTVSSSAAGAKHRENSVHLDAIWMMPVADKIDVGLFGGPSIFSVSQDTITNLTVSEPGPSVSGPLSSIKKTTVGINLGADVQYMLTRRFGVGGVARYTWGSASLTGGNKLTVGGFDIGVGGRVRF